MRAFIVLLIVVGLGLLYWHQRQSETAAAPAKPAAVQQAGAKTPATPLTPAPRGQASQYNWMKRSLDRARDVTEQSRARTQEAQNPQNP